MSSRKRIESACKDNNLEIVSLIYDRGTQPTPGGSVVNEWVLTVKHCEGESHFAGHVEDVVVEIDDFWEDCPEYYSV